MFFLKKFMFGFAALFFLVLGGFGTQSNNAVLQGGGIVGLLIGFIVLYIFAKMAWRAIGLLPSLIVLCAVVFFILYAIGAFSGGFDNIGVNVSNFLGQGVQTSKDVVSTNETRKRGVINLLSEEESPVLGENISDAQIQRPKPKIQNKTKFNPLDYPYIAGISRVISGDALAIGNSVIKLYGIAAPEISQTCADGSGRGYKCGRQAYSWLSGWLADNEVKCHIIQEQPNNLIGVCMLGPYDIGAALVNAGWAVADTRNSSIYVPYQNQAISKQRGLWQGEFYMPWDWAKIKSRKANIRVVKTKKDSSRKKVWYNPFGE